MIFRFFFTFFRSGPKNQPGSRYICIRKPKKSFVMPVVKVPGGYRFGQSGKIYPTKAQAEAQARAIYASGYREKPAQTKKK